MLNQDARHALELPAAASESDEGWLTSYLDVLTLLITLFVLLLALTPPGGGEGRESDAMGPASAIMAMPLASLATGIHPRHDGVQPQMAGLDIPGVSVSQGREGITLRIDDSLLFPSGNDVLTPRA